MKRLRQYHREAVLLIHDEFVSVQGVYLEEGTIRIQHLYAVEDGEVSFNEGGLVVIDDTLYQITNPVIDAESFGTPMIISATLVPYVEAEDDEPEETTEKAICPKCNHEWMIDLPYDPETVVCPECGYDGKEEPKAEEPIVIAEDAAIEEEKKEDAPVIDEDDLGSTPAPDYSSMTAKALYDLCIERGIEIEKRLEKEQYLKALRGY